MDLFRTLDSVSHFIVCLKKKKISAYTSIFKSALNLTRGNKQQFFELRHINLKPYYIYTSAPKLRDHKADKEMP